MKAKLIDFLTALACLACIMFLMMGMAIAQGLIPPPPPPDVLLPSIHPAGMSATIQPRYVHGNTNHIAAIWIFTNEAAAYVVTPVYDTNGVSWSVVTNLVTMATGTVTWPAVVTRYTNGVVKYDIASAPVRIRQGWYFDGLMESTQQDGMRFDRIGYDTGDGLPVRLLRPVGGASNCPDGSIGPIYLRPCWLTN